MRPLFLALMLAPASLFSQETVSCDALREQHANSNVARVSTFEDWVRTNWPSGRFNRCIGEPPGPLPGASPRANTAPSTPAPQPSCEVPGDVRISSRYLSDFCEIAVRVTGGLHGGNTAMGVWLRPYSATVISSRSFEAAQIVTGFWRAWRNMNPRGVRVEVYGGSIHIATVRGVGSPNVIWR